MMSSYVWVELPFDFFIDIIFPNTIKSLYKATIICIHYLKNIMLRN